MTLSEFSHIHRPKMMWTRIHRWGGIALFGFACFGLGQVVSTSYYDLLHLWRIAGTQTSTKIERPTTIPDCVPVHPAPIAHQ